jgi:hypothetical protein
MIGSFLFGKRRWASPTLLQPLVWLNPFEQPVSPLEQTVFVLLAGGPLPLDDLVERLAETNVYREWHRGVWTLEIGAQALPVVRIAAKAALRRLDGGMIAIATAPGIRSQAEASWQLQLCA